MYQEIFNFFLSIGVNESTVSALLTISLLTFIVMLGHIFLVNDNLKTKKDYLKVIGKYGVCIVIPVLSILVCFYLIMKVFFILIKYITTSWEDLPDE